MSDRSQATHGRVSSRTARAVLQALTLSVTVACGDDDGGEPRATVEAGVSGLPDAQSGDAGAPAAPTGPASCDLSGIWIGRMNGQTEALGPQYANTWYYWELAKREGAIEVTRHMDCGIEVRGTVTVQLTPATTRALIPKNQQVGRKGTSTMAADGTCAFELERFWSVRGLDEAAYLPGARNSAGTLASISAEKPLPLREQANLTVDWDGDGQPGISWQVSGIVSGTRATVQRDWTRYFSAPGYELRGASDFVDNIVVRAEFEAQEVVYAASAPTLELLGQTNAAAEHTLTLRFLGRDRSDPRAQALLKPDDFETCLAVRETLPAVRGLR
jgi:hypothetical protein